MIRWIIALLFLCGAAHGAAHAQSVQQSGSVTPNHTACWTTTGIIQDCGIPTTTPYLLTAAPNTLTGTTPTPDFNVSSVWTWTLTATGETLNNPANLTTAQLGQRFVIYLVQDGTGSRTITTWGSVYKFSGGTKPTLTTAAGSTDRVICDVETTTFLTCSATLNFQ